jgi:hypothetical protein
MQPKSLLLAVLSASIGSSNVAWFGEQPPRALANTVWVPRTIAWVQPFPHDAEMSGIQYADFPLLCFRDQGQFMRVSSYHSRGDNDTIIVATEPGIKVDFGRYRVEPTQVVVLSKTMCRTVSFTPSVKDKARTDTLSFKGQHLVYKSIEYRPYTKLSGQSIHSFWAHKHTK